MTEDTMTERKIENIVRDGLNNLADFRKLLSELDQRKNQEIEAILTPEIQAELDAVDAKYASEYEHANGVIAGAELLIKDGVQEHGKTIKGLFLMGVFYKGRTKWDIKALDGYAKAHPELLEFRSEGKPYTVIRGV